MGDAFVVCRVFPAYPWDAAFSILPGRGLRVVAARASSIRSFVNVVLVVAKAIGRHQLTLRGPSDDQVVEEEQNDRPNRRTKNAPAVEPRRPGPAENLYDEPPDGGSRHSDENGDD